MKRTEGTNKQTAKQELSELQKVNSFSTSTPTMAAIERSTPLNYSLQENPYSIYITILKSFRHSENLSNYCLQTQHVTSETRSIVARCQFLEKTTEDLKTSLEDSTNECEAKQEAILEFESRLDIVYKKLDS